MEYIVTFTSTVTADSADDAARKVAVLLNGGLPYRPELTVQELSAGIPIGEPEDIDTSLP